MGMFDTVVTTTVFCPLCGAELDWQTKDGGQALEYLTVHALVAYVPDGERATFYADCDPCRAWIEVSVTVRKNNETSAQMIQRNVDTLFLRQRRGSYYRPAESAAARAEADPPIGVKR